MLTLVISFVDRIIQLAKQQQETDRKLNDDFLVPIVADFEKVHQNYLDSFSSYRSEIEKHSGSFDESHPVLARMQSDSLVSQNLRAKLEALRGFRTDPLFAPITYLTQCYIGSAEAGKLETVLGNQRFNAPRRKVILGLKKTFSEKLSDQEKRDEAFCLIDDVIMELQQEHLMFTRASIELKRKLLDRRM